MKPLRDIYDEYGAINERLVMGERVYFGSRKQGCSFGRRPWRKCRILRYPKIGIYVGVGTSHSWLWFVELFDKMGFHDLVFVDEENIQSHALTDLDVLVMSGGDTFAIAEGLGPVGATKMKAFIMDGGLYIGSCAGAYLPMRSSKEHLNLFNFLNVKIANLTKTLPISYGVSEKFSTPYGCSYIFHPIRDEIRLLTGSLVPFNGVRNVTAPLYGGPSMVASGNTEVLAIYDGFTEKSTLLVDVTLAQETLLGKAAAIRGKMGQGHLYLFGPHFEHPHFPFANKLVADAIYWDMKRDTSTPKETKRSTVNLEGDRAKRFIRDLKRELSNSRIVASGMEMMPVRWSIGNKVYEPAKIRLFLETMFSRIRTLEKTNPLRISPIGNEKLIKSASDVTILLRGIRNDLMQGLDTVSQAATIFRALRLFSSMFLDTYFQSVLAIEKLRL
jgi:glutamine amidotransferase-like uncharacterized protein